MKEKDHYQKAANEIIMAAKELYMLSASRFNDVDFRKAKKLIIKMLKMNFIAKKGKYK